MKFLILALPILVLAINAQADVVNVKLGQNATLQAGDVAIIGNGKMNSAITCGGQQEQQPEPQQPQLPPSQLYEAKEFGKISGAWQGNAKTLGRDMAFGMICVKDSFDPGVSQAQASAVIHARQACFSVGYTNCAQPQNQNELYTFRVVGEREGEYGCMVTARIIGTMQ
ncbi:MAG: hypothetical protein ACXWQO_03365 [Bdellovibrionota bacterium]